MYKGLNKVMANSTLVVAIFIKGTLLKINAKVMEKCFGQMEVFTKVNGKLAFKMEKAKFI